MMSVISKTVGFQFTSENPDKCTVSRKIIFHCPSYGNELSSLGYTYSNRKYLKCKRHLEKSDDISMYFYKQVSFYNIICMKYRSPISHICDWLWLLVIAQYIELTSHFINK